MNDVSLFSYRGGSDDVPNPFGNPLPPVGSNIAMAQVVSRELAEMQAQIYLAKQFPRNQQQATEEILTACQRPSLATVAVYSYVKGGAQVSGPSIRLAEELARCWGNLEYGWDELERKTDSSVVRAYAWDKEKNLLRKTTFVVAHYRTTRQGQKQITDERELYEILANQAARRMRNCVLTLIPGDVVDAAVEQCQRTLVTHVDVSPASIKKLCDAFAALGVTKAQLEKRLQRRIDSITAAQFVKMREIYASLNDGMSAPEDWFPAVEEPAPAVEVHAPEGATATAALKGALNTRKTSSKTRKDEEQLNTQADEQPSQNAAKGAKSTTLASAPQSSAPPASRSSVAEEYRTKILACKTRAELQALGDDLLMAKGISDADRTALYQSVEKRLEQLPKQ